MFGSGPLLSPGDGVMKSADISTLLLRGKLEVEYCKPSTSELPMSHLPQMWLDLDRLFGLHQRLDQIHQEAEQRWGKLRYDVFSYKPSARRPAGPVRRRPLIKVMEESTCLTSRTGT
jgi:hypothetical protein